MSSAWGKIARENMEVQYTIVSQSGDRQAVVLARTSGVQYTQAIPSFSPCMSPSSIQDIARCDFEEACDILEIIEQVLPMDETGRKVMQLPLTDQIRFARMVLSEFSPA